MSYRLLVGGYWQVNPETVHCEHFGPNFLSDMLSDALKEGGTLRGHTVACISETLFRMRVFDVPTLHFFARQDSQAIRL